MLIHITTPVYISDELHLEFTKETIDSIETIHNYKLQVVVNYCKPELRKQLSEIVAGRAEIVDNPKGNVLSAAWNHGIKTGFDKKADYVLVINNDIVFHKKAIDNLVKFAGQHEEFVMWTSAEYESLRELNMFQPTDDFDEHPHFSCFMISKRFVNSLADKELGSKEPYPGYFDENFIPAYFEDGDMHNRILRAGLKAAKTASSRFYHYGSRTIKVDQELNYKNSKTYENNRAYFKNKWGIDPHGLVLSNDAPERFVYKGPFEK